MARMARMARKGVTEIDPIGVEQLHATLKLVELCHSIFLRLLLSRDLLHFTSPFGQRDKTLAGQGEAAPAR